MQIDREGGIPAGDQSDQRPRFGGVELDVVAVEVEAFGVLARADAGDGTILIGAVRDGKSPDELGKRILLNAPEVQRIMDEDN